MALACMHLSRVRTRCARCAVCIAAANTRCQLFLSASSCALGAGLSDLSAALVQAAGRELAAVALPPHKQLPAQLATIQVYTAQVRNKVDTAMHRHSFLDMREAKTQVRPKHVRGQDMRNALTVVSMLLHDDLSSMRRQSERSIKAPVARNPLDPMWHPCVACRSITHQRTLQL